MDGEEEGCWGWWGGVVCGEIYCGIWVDFVSGGFVDLVVGRRGEGNFYVMDGGRV